MKLFDLIPTVGEAMDFISCRLTDHDWTYVTIDDGHYRQCETCGKVEKLKARQALKEDW